MSPPLAKAAQTASPPLLMAGLLASLAGAVDAIGYLMLDGLFVAFMSGNSTILGVSLLDGDIWRAIRAGLIVLTFVSGVALGTLVGRLAQPFHMPAVLFGVTFLLAIAAAWPGANVPTVSLVAIVLAMGAVNTATDTAGGVPVSLTFVTGALVRMGRTLGNALRSDSHDRTWPAQVAVWLGLVVGAVIGAAGQFTFGRYALWGAAAAGLALTLVTAAIPRLRGTAAR